LSALREICWEPLRRIATYGFPKNSYSLRCKLGSDLPFVAVANKLDDEWRQSGLGLSVLSLRLRQWLLLATGHENAIRFALDGYRAALA